MKVLLTGASGFVGARAARALIAAGHEVHCLLRATADRRRLAGVPSLQFLEGDVLTEAGRHAAAAIAPEVCLHCAWYAEPGKYLASPINVDLAQATAQLASALASAGCRRFVGVGTCFEYDTTFGYLSETTPLAPAHLYSAAKAGTFFMLRQLAAEGSMSFVWARLFYLYGPGEHPARLVPSIALALLRGEEARVTPGAQVRDFLHVDDAAAALAHLAAHEVRGAVNVGSGAPVTVASLVTTLGSLTGRAELVKLGARPYAAGDPMFVCADTQRLRSTGWGPRYNLEAGLAAMVRELDGH